MTTYQKGEIGRTLECQFLDDEDDAIDVSSYTTKQIVYRKPGADSATVNAAFVNTGTDGRIDYDVADGSFFDTIGMWTKQGVVSKTGDTRRGPVEQFFVLDNL